ncbi:MULTISPECIES: DUF6482 family protein [unclassified Shewanella]|uniref:DUF6482 family protein n=1 Tax=unclassified Shewanella TaxID=196818 RepID=UPI001BC28CD2|nr:MULTISPECIES: DUF6482 family protein [unclassified Shewanella]GIU05697.1 hypothetical protein TUM4444_02460 [Shewanella sp. MBTL60-112-B1]GIU25918.1 hypothetical protein TUM4445_04660 [Shewanella sp. MBTL60-112-B2]
MDMRQSLNQTLHTSSNQPRIIGVADAPHYLVGAMDDKDNFIRLDEETSVQCVTSLAQAKQLLRRHRYQVAELEYQTAYDEMCGLSCTGNYKETIKL